MILLVALTFYRATQRHHIFSGNTSIQANICAVQQQLLIFRSHRACMARGNSPGHHRAVDAVDTRGIHLSGIGAAARTAISRSPWARTFGTDNTVTSTFNTGLVPVFSAASYTTSAAIAGGWIAIPLSSPFSYNPAEWSPGSPSVERVSK